MRVLYITHYSIMEPLGQSQILPYLKGLATCGNSIEIISFEKQSLLRDRARVIAQNEALASNAISWAPRAYHRGASLEHLLLDVARASVEVARRCRHSRIELIHCRAHVPFLMAWCTSAIHRIPLLFDFRGFTAEEYVDAGLWEEDGIRFRLTKLLERKMSARSDALVVLNHPMREYVQNAYRLPAEKIFVIPCCVDMKRFSSIAPPPARAPLGPLKVVYSGSTDGRYDLASMLRFFSLLRMKRPRSRFTILSTGDLNRVNSLVTASGVPSEAVTVLSVQQSDVPAALSQHDIGLLFLRGDLTLLAASPTKIGEYLAGGLAVVAEKGIGGLEDVLPAEGVGLLVDSDASASWDAAATEAIRLCDQPDIRLRTAQTAAKYYTLSHGVETYAQAYKHAVQSHTRR